MEIVIEPTWALVFATIGLIIATLIYAYYTRKQTKLLRSQITMQLFNFVYEHRFDNSRGLKFPEDHIPKAKELLEKMKKLYKELGLD